MKDTTSHRKRTKSETDSAKHHGKGSHDTGGGKNQLSSGQSGHHGGRHSPHHGSQHGTHHGSHHGGQHGAHHGAHHGSHHVGHHQKGDHGHHGDHGHQDGDHHYPPMRPRRDTMMSRGHSIHHDADRRSNATSEAPAPIIHYENTYKMTPDCRIHEGKIREIIKAAFEENIKEKVYDGKICGQKSQLISEIIKERVKKLSLSRFKIICLVMIGQVYDQSMLVTSRCLWDQRFDNSITVEYKIGDIVAVGLVFAAYSE